MAGEVVITGAPVNRQDDLDFIKNLARVTLGCIAGILVARALERKE